MGWSHWIVEGKATGTLYALSSSESYPHGNQAAPQTQEWMLESLFIDRIALRYMVVPCEAARISKINKGVLPLSVVTSKKELRRR